jgi:hypothetical protein
MALRLISLLVSLVLMAFLASTMRDRLSTTHKESPASPQTLLRTAGMVVERTHQLTGEYAGVGLEGGSALSLVSADATGYCLQLEWVDRSIYHLRGPGGQPAAGAC